MLDVCVVHHRSRPLRAETLDFVAGLPGNLLLAFDSGPHKTGHWVRRVAGLREALHRRVRSAFWVSLDDDLVIRPEDAWTAVRWLVLHPDWAGVGVWNGDGTPPAGKTAVRMGSAVWRASATQDHVIEIEPTPDGNGYVKCECGKFGDSLIKAGWNLGYHPTLTVRHLGD